MRPARMRHLTAWLSMTFALAACGDDDTSSSAGSGGSGADGSGAAGASSGSGTPTSGSGAGATGGSGSTTGSGGGLPACVTDVVLLAEAGQSVDCSYPLPSGVDDASANVILEVSNAPQQLCRRASSQGCDTQSPGGWWTNGGDILLCDSSCTTLVETAGAKLYLWVGCPSDNCL